MYSMGWNEYKAGRYSKTNLSNRCCRLMLTGGFSFVRQAWRVARKLHLIGCGG